ncbi:4'-phosphopantetheinyl transferase family protein [Sanguibacter sp. Leaf3]|uniref:4'-phosphopantetheinyl transferase family protein n=1 Tax=Sanguibacter sp. Leaf3 TaxID=1736209 RepID=UPI0006F567BA|nr:4'-phosphopantetheinyl transferase superfamily protein [Sanguibacter sp. Leaf3]KQT96287.1 hypothetical protein ASG53_14240 [Sanguibacter sp. Leaf3]
MTGPPQSRDADPEDGLTAGHGRGGDGVPGIRRVAPLGSAAVDTTLPGTPADLLGPERDGTERMVPSRLAEFAAARRCGHLALEGLGVRPVGIPRGVRGRPFWPVGVIGSLTHCGGYAAAVVADARDLAGLGIDAEPHAPLPPKVLEHVSGPPEIDDLATLSAVSPGIAWDRIQFCAKEAAFKTLSASDQRCSRLVDLQVRIELTGTVTVVPRLSGPGRSPGAGRGDRRHGWWAVELGRIVVCVALEHDQRALTNL